MTRLRQALGAFSGVAVLICLTILSLEIGFVLTDTTRALFSDIYQGIMLYFIGDFLMRLLISRNKKKTLLTRVMDLALVLPFLGVFIPSLGVLNDYIVIQLVLLAVVLGRLTHVNELFRLMRFNPAQLFIMGFIMAIFIGALFLSLPQARVGDAPISFVDAIFTASSAICVTGLSTLDIGTHFSGFGQGVILVLIQLGGIGIMTFYAMITLFLNRKLSQEEHQTYQSSYQSESSESAFSVIRSIVIITFLIEFLGAVTLFFLWKDRFQTHFEAIYYSIFHSISAFCNAGFSLFSNSLESFANAPIILLSFTVLIMIGGIGFPVIFNLYEYFFSKNDCKGLKLQSKLTLLVTLLLLIFGTLLILGTEFSNSLSSYPFAQKLWLSFFHSVSARTAGFQAMPLTGYHPGTIWGLMILMFIGASPGSTGGGIKTTTFGLLLSSFWATLQGRSTVEVFGRRITLENIFRALSIITLSTLILAIFFYLFLIIEKQEGFVLLFESISAVATVGFSLDLTPKLSNMGKILLCVLMLLGRIGPLSFAFALSKRKSKANYAFPEEKILLG